MSVALHEERNNRPLLRSVMRANVFRSPSCFGLEKKAIPRPVPARQLCRCASPPFAKPTFTS